MDLQSRDQLVVIAEFFYRFMVLMLYAILAYKVSRVERRLDRSVVDQKSVNEFD